MKQMLNKAIVLAAAVHDGQYDRAGQPYILHVMKVFHYLKSDDEELNCIAVLHDVVEDSVNSDNPVTIDNLREMEFSERVVQAVDALTKKDWLAYEDYVTVVLANPDARKVKKCDLRHNMDIRRLKGVRQKDLDRLARYAVFYNRIEEAEKA